jgi:hypothetical protein
VLVGGRAECCGKKNDWCGLQARQLLLRAATARNVRHPVRKCGFAVHTYIPWRAQRARRGARGGPGGRWLRARVVASAVFAAAGGQLGGGE